MTCAAIMWLGASAAISVVFVTLSGARNLTTPRAPLLILVAPFLLVTFVFAETAKVRSVPFSRRPW